MFYVHFNHAYNVHVNFIVKITEMVCISSLYSICLTITYLVCEIEFQFGPEERTFIKMAAVDSLALHRQRIHGPHAERGENFLV